MNQRETLYEYIQQKIDKLPIVAANRILERIDSLNLSDDQLEIFAEIKPRGLLILSVPRSGSTILELICQRAVGLPRQGEVLNRYFYPELQYGIFPSEKYDILKHICEQNRGMIIRDVTQTWFIVENIDWLKEIYNVLLLIRPIEDVFLCWERRGWDYDPDRLRERHELLAGLHDDEAFSRITYDQFVHNSDTLYRILKNWYPKCNRDNYLTPQFVGKRNEVDVYLNQRRQL